jgi:hypothetical protein
VKRVMNAKSNAGLKSGGDVERLDRQVVLCYPKVNNVEWITRV